jgi:DNA repair exonuclease SbcCD nuclease subunit
MRIFLTSDLHLGMKFAGYPDAAQAALVEARFACLERMVAMAGAERCDLLVVAGDLFERVTVARRDIQRAAETLRGFSGRLVAVMPGNHDFIAPDDELWPRFKDAGAGSLLVLDSARPYPLSHFDLNACLYPGPCTAKHSATNVIGWVSAASREAGTAHPIGVAHGSLEGYSPDMDGRYYPMRQRELLDAGMDLWLLGHTHVRFPATPGAQDRIYCAGTPEPDGFDCTHEGYAFVIDLDDSRKVSARAVRTGRLRFVDQKARIANASDLTALETTFTGPDSKTTLLRLELSGRVSGELRASIGPAQSRLAARLLHLDLRAEELREEITREDIDAEYSVGSFPHSLLLRLLESGDQEALERAHTLLAEARP